MKGLFVLREQRTRRSNPSTRSSSKIALGLTMLVLLTCVLGNLPGSGAPSGLGVGTVAVFALDMTTPGSYADTSLWASVWAWGLEGLLGLEAGASYYDLTSMQVSLGSYFYAAGIIQPILSDSVAIGGRLGVILRPSAAWINIFGGPIVSLSLSDSAGLSASVGLQTDARTRTDWLLYLSLCAYIVFPAWK